MMTKEQVERLNMELANLFAPYVDEINVLVIASNFIDNKAAFVMGNSCRLCALESLMLFIMENNLKHASHKGEEEKIH